METDKDGTNRFFDNETSTSTLAVDRFILCVAIRNVVLDIAVFCLFANSHHHHHHHDDDDGTVTETAVPTKRLNGNIHYIPHVIHTVIYYYYYSNITSRQSGSHIGRQYRCG